MLILPVAQGATSAHPTITLTAPYTGVITSPSTGTAGGGCGAGRIVHAPSFNPTTGLGVFSARAHASSCPGIFGDSGSASAGFTITVPISVYTGNDIIHSKWTVKAALGSRIGPASCVLHNFIYSDCYSAGFSYLTAYAYVVDETSGLYYISTNFWPGAFASSSLYDYCYAGNCTLTLTGNMHVVVNTVIHWTFNATGLNASHLYVLEAAFTTSLSAYDSSYDATLTGANEAAFTTMSGPGFGATLDSITIR